LPFSENNVTFEFSVLDFSNPTTNRYRYRLLPTNHDWIYSGTVHSANYGALTPGRYVFEVQGATADSPWSNSVQFYLEIRPPWYRTTAALLAYALLLLLAGWGYLRYREYHFKLRHSVESSQRESARLKEFDAVKNNFFTNIAHELRTPLTVILGLTDRLRRRETGDDPDLHLQKIARQSQHLLELSTQVLDLARLDSQHLALHYYHGNIADFVHEHVEALTPLAANKNVTLHLTAEAPSLWMDFDLQQFF
jgi:signal transduction histidine kinase